MKPSLEWITHLSRGVARIDPCPWPIDLASSVHAHWAAASVYCCCCCCPSASTAPSAPTPVPAGCPCCVPAPTNQLSPGPAPNYYWSLPGWTCSTAQTSRPLPLLPLPLIDHHSPSDCSHTPLDEGEGTQSVSGRMQPPPGHCNKCYWSTQAALSLLARHN